MLDSNGNGNGRGSEPVLPHELLTTEKSQELADRLAWIRHAEENDLCLRCGKDLGNSGRVCIHCGYTTSCD